MESNEPVEATIKEPLIGGTSLKLDFSKTILGLLDGTMRELLSSLVSLYSREVIDRGTEFAKRNDGYMQEMTKRAVKNLNAKYPDMDACDFNDVCMIGTLLTHMSELKCAVKAGIKLLETYQKELEMQKGNSAVKDIIQNAPRNSENDFIEYIKSKLKDDEEKTS